VLPGDELTPKPRVKSTRAITIEAPPERVWPWIVQMGIERAGFYTHDWFERLLFHARYVEGRHSATRIHPEPQELEVGDLIPYAATAASGYPRRACLGELAEDPRRVDSWWRHDTLGESSRLRALLR
jgi:hypothetical protein